MVVRVRVQRPQRRVDRNAHVHQRQQGVAAALVVGRQLPRRSTPLRRRRGWLRRRGFQGALPAAPLLLLAAPAKLASRLGPPTAAPPLEGRRGSAGRW